MQGGVKATTSGNYAIGAGVANVAGVDVSADASVCVCARVWIWIVGLKFVVSDVSSVSIRV